MRNLLSIATLLFPALVACTSRTGFVQSSGCRGGSGSNSLEVRMSRVIYGAQTLGAGYSRGKCTVELKARSSYKRLMVRFTKLDLPGLDKVDIYDGRNTGSTKLNSYSLSGYDTYPDKVYRSSGRYLTLVFNAKTSNTWTYGFTALLTEFDTGSCSSSEFECCDGDCIDYSLKHDADNNCKDKSDESWTNCDDFGYVRIWVYVGSAVGSVLFLVVVGTIIGCCICASQRNRARRNVPPAMVAYPRGGGVAITTASAAYPQQMYAPGPPPPHPYPQAQCQDMAPPHYDVVTQGANPQYPPMAENKY